MRYGSVCSGIEAATVAWRPLGWECAFVAEIDEFACEVLKTRLPNVPNLGDFTKIGDWGMGNGEWKERDERAGNGESGMGNGKRGGGDVGEIDLLVGGSPCQSFSSGGCRGGVADPRGGLALEFARLADRSRCRWVVWENVPSVLKIGGGRDFAKILSEFVGWDVEVPDGGWGNAGICTGADGRFGVAWRVLDARYTRVPPFPGAVPQRRRRLVLVGRRGDWTRAAEALLGGELCGGAAPPKRGDGNAAPAGAGARPEGECFPIDMMNLEGRTKRLKTKCYDAAGAAMYTLRSSHVNAICTPTQLRRLLPVESERLMGLPPGWTDVPWKGMEHAPDGLRHRACGNSMCVNVMRWVGERVAAVEAGKEFGDYGIVKDRGGDGTPPPLAEARGG